VAQLNGALYYKPEDSGFDFRLDNPDLSLT